MADINVDEIGPVDYLVVGFPADKANFSGEMASELKTLIDSNTVRVLDLVVLTNADDGSVEASELRDATTVRSVSCARWSGTSRTRIEASGAKRSLRRISAVCNRTRHSAVRHPHLQAVNLNQSP